MHWLSSSSTGRWVAALIAVLLVLAWVVAAAAAGQAPEPPFAGTGEIDEAEDGASSGYLVEPPSRTIRLSAPPDSPVESSGAFTILRRRRTPLQERVYYSVEGDLRSYEGRTLPWSALQISGVTGEWGSRNVLVLDAGQRRARFSVRVLPEAWYDGDTWRYAGTYRGHLIPNVVGAPVLEVIVRIDPFLRVDVSSDRVHIVADSGVGVYESAEPLVVTVRANYPEWFLSRWFTAPRLQGEGRRDVIPLSQLRISENGGPFTQVPERPQIWLSGADLAEPRLVVRELRLQVEVTWEELPGRYEGAMRLTVVSSDEGEFDWDRRP